MKRQPLAGCLKQYKGAALATISSMMRASAQAFRRFVSTRKTQHKDRERRLAVKAKRGLETLENHFEISEGVAN